MSFSNNVTTCSRRCIVRVPRRRYNSGSSQTVDSKMQAKTVVLNQWKLITSLKNYLSNVTSDKAFENAINKEFAYFLQKIQPKTYGDGLTKFFNSTVAAPEISNTEMKEKGNISLPNVFTGFKIKLGTNNKEAKTVPKWKSSKPAVSVDSINSRTSQVMSALCQANNEVSKLAKIEDLIAHLKQYPEAKHNAVKEGAIRVLLRIRNTSKSENITSAIGEAFALLGHADPVPGRGIRVLSIDGGGVRGILVIEMLKKLEEFTGKPIYEMFDVICGVSTGAIIATLAGLKRLTLDEVADTYKNLSTQIFTQSAIKGTSNLVWSHSYYDTALWEKLLKEQWGNKKLISTQRDPNCPKFCALSAVVNQSRLSAFVFRNYSLPYKVQSQYIGGYDYEVWQAVRATAAAPTYFEEFKLGNMLHQDGGILVNNPTAVAIHEAKLLWPHTPLQCVVSFGTGRTAPNPADTSCAEEVTNSSWKNKFFAIIDSATDTEGVHTMLSDLLPPDVYYRFNPYISEMMDIAEIQPEKLEQLKRDAVMYLRRNEDKFKEAAKTLELPKTTMQKCVDWVNYQKCVLGFSQS